MVHANNVPLISDPEQELFLKCYAKGYESILANKINLSGGAVVGGNKYNMQLQQLWCCNI